MSNCKLWMIETNISFHAATNLCYTLSTILAEKSWWSSFSAILYIFSVQEFWKLCSSEQQYWYLPWYQGRSEHDIQFGVLDYLIGDSVWQVSAQPLDIRSSDLLLNRYDFNGAFLISYVGVMSAMPIQTIASGVGHIWYGHISGVGHIRCRTHDTGCRCSLGVSRCVFDHQHTARKTRNYLKRNIVPLLYPTLLFTTSQ